MASSPDMLVSMRINSDPVDIAPLRRAIEQLCQGTGFDQAACDEIGLVVNEAIANIIRHAYARKSDKPIQVDMRVHEDELQVKIRDWGNGVDPSKLPPKKKDPLEPGGLGLICLKQMMDTVVFSPQPDGMLLEMTRKAEHRGRRC